MEEKETNLTNEAEEVKLNIMHTGQKRLSQSNRKRHRKTKQ